MDRIETIRFLYDKLKPVQKEIFNKFLDNKKRTSVFHCSRRLGKSYLLCVLSIIYALKKPNSQIRYASVTQKSVKKIVQPIFKEIFTSIPKKFRGRWNSQEGAYLFENGSVAHIAGVSLGHVDDLRGTATDLALIDEAGFIDDLGYLINSVLMPQLLTVPNSRLIMASSSPLSPAHDFVEYIQKAKFENSYHSYTIHDGGYSQSIIEEFCNEAGGKDSTTWCREYLNHIIVDSDYAIIPEASTFEGGVHRSEDRSYYHNYVAMDIGTRDLTVILFAYYDFKRATLVIEDEYYINGPKMTTPLIAEAIKDYEKRLWNNKEPYKRISDNNNLLLLQDLGYLHNCHFIPTSKDNLEAMVNEMRIWFANKRIEIDPKCKLLIESVKFGFWNEQRSNFGRSATLGHFDAIAALMYLIRNIDQTTNPIPLKLTFDQFCIEDENSNIHELSKLLNI